jgi:pyruvate kinase
MNRAKSETRRARIVCTIGPATQSKEGIRKLVEAGMNVARLNFSHGDHDTHEEVYNRIREVSEELHQPVAILQDLQGPKIRVGKIADGSVMLKDGSTFTLTTDEVIGDETRASISYRDLPRDVEVGERILLDDGLLELRITEVTGNSVVTEVVIGGELKDRKGVNLPNTAISQPSLTRKDREDLEFGVKLGVDYIALSFVRSGLDIHQLRCYLPTGKDSPHIIAKIEKPQAIDNIDEIIHAADGIMIARGDLGVEMPPERVPLLQKEIIQEANSRGKLTITATQMLESMTFNARPTRAEASDVANAVLDGTDAVMLSGETATGDYPNEAVKMMARIIVQAETVRAARTNVRPSDQPKRIDGPRAIARAAQVAAKELSLPVLACFTVSGLTPRLIKSYRPKRRILAFTPEVTTWRRMALYWGVEPILTPALFETTELLKKVEDTVLELRYAERGQSVLVVLGHPAGHGSPTNMIKLHRIGETEEYDGNHEPADN